MALSDSYYKSRPKKKLWGGGPVTNEKPTKMSSTVGGVNAGLGMASTVVDAIDTPNDYGRTSIGGSALKGAASGAAMGSVIGPWGTVVGGVVGGAVGAISGAGKKKKEAQMINAQNVRLTQKQTAEMSARLSADPSLVTGSLAAEYYATGGKLGDPTPKTPLTPTDYGNWNNVVKYARTKNFDATALDHDSNIGYGAIDEYNKANPKAQFDRTRVQDIQQLMSDYRGRAIDRMKAITPYAQKASNFYPSKQYGEDYAGFMGGISKVDNFPGSRTLNWEVPQEYMTTKTPSSTTTNRVGFAPQTTKATGGPLETSYREKKADGGKLVQQSSDGVEVQGHTHAQGGVQIPGAEVEGGETIKDDFVYSAQLGFAQKHKPLMVAKGKIEQKPASPERINALRIIEQKEQQLALAQEYFKKKNKIK